MAGADDVRHHEECGEYPRDQTSGHESETILAQCATKVQKRDDEEQWSSAPACRRPELVSANGTYRLWLEPVFPGKTYAVFGEGFVPGEEVMTAWTSRGAGVTATVTATEDGTLPLTFLDPSTPRKQYDATYRVRGSGSDLTVEFEWGPPAREWK